MTAAAKQSDNDMVVQEHCIDLPGESVQCWLGGGTDKLKVILRKHRDVIFDLRLGNGKSYTVESTESDFYNARDKKIVLAAKHTPVTFRDGERLHLWVSRGFRGALVVRCDGHVMAKVEPNEWDKHRHSEDPKEKPAPIIIAIGKNTAIVEPAPLVPAKVMAQLHMPAKPGTPTLPRPASAPVHEETCPTICVVEGKAEGMPEHIKEYFQKGGDHSGLSDIDPNHVATRNWLWGLPVGAGAYVKDNWEWLRASIEGKDGGGFKFVKAQVHYVRGKVRFYFSGYRNANKVFGRGGFGPGNERIMDIFAGVGKTSSGFAATLKGVAVTFKNTAILSLIFNVGTAFAEWTEDVKKDGYDLTAAILMAIIKAILVSALVVLVVAACVFIIMMAGAAAVSVFAIGALTLAAGVLLNYAVESVDKAIGRSVTGNPENTDGAASIIAPWLRKASKEIEHNWHYLMNKFPRDYKELHF